LKLLSVVSLDPEITEAAVTGLTKLDTSVAGGADNKQPITGNRQLPKESPMTASVLDRIRVEQGDITRLRVDAIVNAANTSLLGGGGVDGAIHRAAGPELLAECRTLGGCPTGEARITKGYRLPARHVIHTVGPVYSGRPADAVKLAACYRNSLQLAMDHDLRTIAFPAISCGVYGYPVEKAVAIALDTTATFLADHDRIEEVIFVVFSPHHLSVYQDALGSRRASA
jgi:O-acetyl-ADP-ribose deacetylase (regulator of RNase III)